MKKNEKGKIKETNFYPFGHRFKIIPTGLFSTCCYFCTCIHNVDDCTFTKYMIYLEFLVSH